jgi:RNA polymerase sigma-70 factor (ECF subfamily)
LQHANFIVDIADLLKRIASGDRDAFAEVVETFQRPLFGFLARMGISKVVAAEIAQETFLRAWRNLDQYQSGRAQFSTWLFSIARNLALNELTRASNRNGASTGGAGVMDVGTLRETLDQVVQEETNARLRDGLLRLPLPERTTLALAYVRELPLAEIAVLEHTTVGAVKTRLHRAKAKLWECLETADE